MHKKNDDLFWSVFWCILAIIFTGFLYPILSYYFDLRDKSLAEMIPMFWGCFMGLFIALFLWGLFMEKFYLYIPKIFQKDIFPLWVAIVTQGLITMQSLNVVKVNWWVSSFMALLYFSISYVFVRFYTHKKPLFT